VSTVGIRCDAGARTGVGHLVRCVALAEELTARGVAVHFLSDLGGLPRASAQLDSRALPWHPAPYDAVGLAAAAVRAGGRIVLAVGDGALRGQVADVYVDQNLDAELASPRLPPGAVRLAGLDYVLLRRAVRELRPAAPRDAGRARTPKVVAFFGGTDAYRAAPVLARLLVRTGAAFDATVVAADGGLRADLLALAPGPGQRIEVIAPTDDCRSCSRTPTSRSAPVARRPGSCSAWACPPRWSQWWRTSSSGTSARSRAGSRPDSATCPPWPPSRSRRSPCSAACSPTLPPGRPGARAWAAVDGQGVARVADALLGAVTVRQNGASRNGSAARRECRTE
jgi:hypothetical protein